MTKYLIAGLGNPGLLYENTRHNIGFKVIKAIAKKYDLKLKKEKKFLAKIAMGKVLDNDVYLMMPQTYMNESGVAIKKVKDFFKVDLENILIVTDDADIDFEEFRLKKSSSAGGHNGLKSVEKHLGTRDYARLRVGIGRKERPLKKHVLDRFTKEEKEKLKNIEKNAVDFIEIWLKKGAQTAANKANVRLKKK